MLISLNIQLHVPSLQAQLRSQLAALGHALRNKEAEVESLKATISLKDSMIEELQDQLAKVMADRARLEERIRELMEEKNKLEVCVCAYIRSMAFSKVCSIRDTHFTPPHPHIHCF